MKRKPSERGLQQAYLEYNKRSVGYRPITAALLLQVLQLLHRVQTEEDSTDAEARPEAADKIDEMLHYIDRQFRRFRVYA